MDPNNDSPTDRLKLARSLGMTLDELNEEERQLREWHNSATHAEIGEFKSAIRQELRRRRALMN